MKFMVLTLYPAMFEKVFSEGVIARAQEKNLIKIQTKNIRDFAEGKRKNVDDTPFGGGAGMVMSPEPLFQAIDWAKKTLGKKAKVVFLSPTGTNFTQRKAEKIAENGENLILLAGRFEGIDERVRQELVDEEISIGDYVLSGGEIPAMVLIDTITRLLPGALGAEESAQEESFSETLFFQKEFPQYTRPADFRGLKVPSVLLSGDAKKIHEWRLANLKGLSPVEQRVLTLRLKEFPLKTKRVILRLHQKTDIDYWMKWMNDEEVMKYLALTPPLNREDEENFYYSSRKNLKMFPLAIVDKKTNEPIGNIDLRIHPLDEKSAELGINIGNKEYWNKGIATEAITALLHFAFKKAGFERVDLKVFANNIPAQKAYEKCGFQKTGEMHKALLKNKKFFDGYYMEILREDFLRKK